MAEVPVRQPRFLGEKVPYRNQSMQESIQQELGGDYVVESSNGGYVARAKPVPYISKRDKSQNLKTKSTFVPKEIFISSEGQVEKEIVRGTYMSDTWDDGFEQSPFEKEITDYKAQTKYTYGKRKLKSGRETIRQTSSLVGGEYKEKRIIDQTSKEYEQAKQESDLFQTFVSQGKSYAAARILSRMSEAQREAKFKAEAKARTQQFSTQGKAITLQHQTQREFESEYQTSAQKYAGDIVAKQETARSQKSPVVQTPKAITQSYSVIPEPTNPASPTTRTDMGQSFVYPPTNEQFGTPQGKIEESKPFQYRTGFTVTDPEKYQQQLILESDKGVVVFGKSIPGTATVQRGIDKYRFGYAEQTKGLDFHPALSKVVVPFAVGSVNIITGTLAHPVQVVQSMLNPVQLAKDVRTELNILTVTKGETYALSYLGGTVAGAEVLGRGAKKGVELAKDTYVKTGSKYVEPERVFSKEVLEEKQTFPTTKSTAESLASFNRGGKSPDISVAEAIVKNPEAYAKPPVKGAVIMSNEVLRDIQVSVPQENIVYTGGVARRVLTGEGRIRDVDVVSKSPQADAYAVAKRFPEKYEIVQHEKYPEIYRLRSKKTGEMVADFDPVYLAEEGLINAKSIVRVGDYNVVKPEILLKSKATQIVKGKANPKYPLKQAENIQQLSPETPILKDEVIVSTVSPAKLKGTVVSGKVEKVGLEDSGIYVSPKGEASAYFTGLASETTTYSLNPLKGIIGVPTVTEFAVKGVRTYPKEVVLTPGFEHLSAYQQSQVGKGYAYITKRSQVGTGDVPRQKFFLSKPTKMSGETVEPGIRWEAGTVEKEAVIGEGEAFAYSPKTKVGKLKGFDFYTEYKGRAVAVRTARLLTEGDIVSPGNIIVEGGKVQAGAEAFEMIASESKVTTPAAYGKALPFGSLKVVETKTKSYSKPPAVTLKVDLGGVSSSQVRSKTSVVSGLSRISPTQSVQISSVKSTKSQVSPVSSPISPVSGMSISESSVGGLLSGKSFGGGSSGISTGGSIGGGSSGISKGGSSRGGGETVPREYPRTYPRPETKAEKKKEQFRVEVRKKGVFKTIAVTETPEEAFRIGKVNVEQTASASLRVKPVNTGEKVTGIGKSFLPESKFRLSQKEPDVFIQKRKFRISSPGEKKEITFKGIFMQKQKKARKGIFG